MRQNESLDSTETDQTGANPRRGDEALPSEQGEDGRIGEERRETLFALKRATETTGIQRFGTGNGAHGLMVAGAGILVVVAHRLATADGVVRARLVIAVALFVITCGPILLWFRKDNVFAYSAVGTYLTALLLPLVGTATLTDFEPHTVDQYARLMAVGAVFFAAGLALGGHFSARTRPRLRFTFGLPLTADSPAWQVVRRRTRMVTAIAAISLAAAFALLRYVPLLAADRQLAKYGVGVYAPGFARGRLVYHFALALGAAILPMAIVVAYRTRGLLDVVLCGGVALGLLASLSRSGAFAGPLLVIIAIAIGRRVAPALIVAAVCLIFLAGALSNELLFSSVRRAPTLAARLAASAPDVHDQLAFLRGFEREGSQQTLGKTLIAKLGPEASQWDPVAYSLRLTTGITDASAIASGGIRLPAPLWGFSSFGFPGAAGFCLVSGLFIGWGTVRVRNVVTRLRSYPSYSTNLVLGAVFFEGTFGFFGSFFFAPFGDIVVLGAAMMIGVMPWLRHSQLPERDDAMATVGI